MLYHLAPLLVAAHAHSHPCSRALHSLPKQRQHRRTFIKVQQQGRKLDKMHSDIVAAKMAEEAKATWKDSQKHSRLKDLPAEQLAMLREMARTPSPTGGRGPEKGAMISFEDAEGELDSEDENELGAAVCRMTAAAVGLPPLSEFEAHPRRTQMAQRRIVRERKRQKEVHALLREQQLTFGELGAAAYNAAKLKHEGAKGAPRLLSMEDVKSMVRA